MLASPGLLRFSYAGQVAVIGDIHGRADLLELLLEQIEPLPVIVTGDVCDRGPESRRAIDLLVARGARGVLGNHDEWLLAWASRQGFDDFALHSSMGGRATLDSYGVTGRTVREIEEESWRVPTEHARWLRTLGAAIDLRVGGEKYWITHAGLSPRLLPDVPAADRIERLARDRPGDLRWPSTAPADVPDTGRTLVMGHVPHDAPVDIGRVLAIDTGAGRSVGAQALTAVILPERCFITVRDAGLPWCSIGGT